jgi:Initiator Replication protein
VDTNQAPAPDTATPRTIEIVPRGFNEAIKPAELIQITGHQSLSLQARRVITLLYRNASLQGIAQGRDYQVEMDLLKPHGHKGYEQIEEAITALMKTIVAVKLPDGGTRRVQLLGGNDMDDPNRPRGMLTYSFDKRLVAILEDSRIWGKLEISVLMAFTTKYAISLYENIAQFVGLKYTQSKQYSLAEFRELLGVEKDKYPKFGEFYKHVVKPAVAEINGLASFTVALSPIKEGRKVTGVSVLWMAKSPEKLGEAYRELANTRTGRRARLMDTVEIVTETIPAMKGPQHAKQLSEKLFGS